MQVPVEAREGIRSTGAEVTGVVNHSTWVLGNSGSLEGHEGSLIAEPSL